jgi:hypothetical protein
MKNRFLFTNARCLIGTGTIAWFLLSLASVPSVLVASDALLSMDFERGSAADLSTGSGGRAFNALVGGAEGAAEIVKEEKGKYLKLARSPSQRQHDHGHVVVTGFPNSFPFGFTFACRVRLSEEEYGLAVPDERLVVFSTRTADHGPGMELSIDRELRPFAIAYDESDAEQNFYGGTLNATPRGFTLPAGEWVHLAMTNDGGVYTVYVNGSEFARSPKAIENEPPGLDRLTLGAYNQGYAYPFYGDIDDVVIFDRALTRKEIAELAKKVK